MPQLVEVEGVGTVEFSDDFTREEIMSQVDNIFARQEMAALQAKADLPRRLAERAAAAETLVSDPFGEITRGASAGLELLGMQSPDVSIVPTAVQKSAREAIEQNPILQGSILGAMPELVESVSQIATPTVVGTAPLLAVGGTPAKVAVSAISGQAAARVPQTIQEYQQAPPDEKAKRGADAIVNAVVAGLPVVPSVVRGVKQVGRGEWIPEVPEIPKEILPLVQETAKATAEVAAPISPAAPPGAKPQPATAAAEAAVQPRPVEPAGEPITKPGEPYADSQQSAMGVGGPERPRTAPQVAEGKPGAVLEAAEAGKAQEAEVAAAKEKEVVKSAEEVQAQETVKAEAQGVTAPAAEAVPARVEPTPTEQPQLAPPTRSGATLQPLPQAVPVETVKGQSEIIRDIAKGLELPIRFGRLTSSKAGGYFKKVANLIGSRKANDIPVVSHEVGHKLDSVFDLSTKPNIRTELEFLGDPGTPGSRSSWTQHKSQNYKRAEGIGEFVRYWLTEPAEAARVAPNTKTYFESVLDANKDFGDVMRQAQRDIELWRTAPSEARLASSISVGGNPNKTRYGATQLTRDLVDDLHVVGKAVAEAEKNRGYPFLPSQNPYLLARNLRGSYGAAASFLQSGIADFRTRAVRLGTSLEDALKGVSGRIDSFRNFLVAKQAQELHRQGKETGLVRADVDAVVNKYLADPDFVDAFAKVRAWQDSVLQYAVDAGYVTQQGAAAMRAMNRDYVPFARVFEIGAGEVSREASFGTGRGLNVGKVTSLRKRTGSTRDIVDPLESMVHNAYAIITASEKAAINRAIADLSKEPGMGKWVEKIANPKERLEVTIEKLREQLEDAGADVSNVPDDLILNFYRDAGKAPYGENIIRVVREGKPEYYRLKSDLYDAFNALDAEDSGMLVRVLSSPAQLLRAGVTLTPDFALSNFIRDAVSSAVINKYGLLPFEASVKGLAAMIRNPKLVSEWAASGGSQSIEAGFFDRQKSFQFLKDKIAKDLTPAERALVVVKSPLRALRWMTERVESATRIGEYQKAFQAGVRSGLPEGEARRLAAFESRDRQDFAKGGAKTKILRHAAAFWNAGLQANVTLASAFKNRPVRTVLQGLAYVTIPKLLEQALNWNDNDYWDRPQWERDLFFMIPIGKDENGKSKFLRIPTPFEIGIIFGTIPGRMLQWAREKDPKALDGLMHNVLAQTIPNPVPQIGQVLVADALTGKQGWDIWRGREVVPDSLADLPPELQWTEQTSLTAKKIGAALGFSPMKVDHIIAGTTGGLGRQLVHNVADRAISAVTGEPVTARGTAPGMRFVTTPAGITSEAVTQFYDELERLRTVRAGSKAKGVVMPADDAGKLRALERASDRMSDLRKQAKLETDPVKKQKLYLDISELAKKLIGRAPAPASR